jgi:hypothetical protein
MAGPGSLRRFGDFSLMWITSGLPTSTPDTGAKISMHEVPESVRKMNHGLARC